MTTKPDASVETTVGIPEDNARVVITKMLEKNNETEADIRRAQVKIQEFKCLMEIEKLKLSKISLAYNIASQVARCSDKMQERVGKIMVGMFPELDATVASILKSSRQLEKLKTRRF